MTTLARLLLTTLVLVAGCAVANAQTTSSKKPCALVACAAPPPGCTYGLAPVDQNGCNTSCGPLTCPTSPKVCSTDTKVCPDGGSVGRNPDHDCAFDLCRKHCFLFSCAAPPPDCTYSPAPVDQLGCATGCGTLTCPTPPPKVCSTDTKECPDGGSVGRNPNQDCAFDPCPTWNRCPLYSCTAPPPGCRYGAAPVDPNGCATGCGTLNCPASIVCPADTKNCPDGSSVGRNPNNQCAFDRCPTLDCLTCPHGFIDGCKECSCGDPKSRFPAFCTIKSCSSDTAARCKAATVVNVCPSDAKVCLDGSTVKRNPKNKCAFDTCPPPPPVPPKVDCKSCPHGFVNGCNTCSCSPLSGRAACTLTACRVPRAPQCITPPLLSTQQEKCGYLRHNCSIR